MTSSRWLGLALSGVQLIDIVIHVATDQAEPIRIFSNVVLLAWAALLFVNPMNANIRLWGMAALFVYFSSNMFFLSQAGLTNPEQGGGLRIMLLILVALSSMLTLIALASLKRVSP